MQHTLRSLLLALGLLAATATAAQDSTAAPLTEEQWVALETRVIEFGNVLASPDMAGLFGFLPPGIRATLARQSDQSEAEAERALDAQVQEAMAGAAINSLALDPGAATFRTTPDGGRVYALVPTALVIALEGQGTAKVTAETLAFEEDGEWYFVRVSEPSQQQVLVAAYPEFAGVTFAPSQVEPLE